MAQFYCHLNAINDAAHATKHLPNGAANLCLVLGKVNILENHILAISYEIFIIFIAQITAIGLSIVQG